MSGVQIEGGGLQGLPTINKNWISWADATPDQWISEGGDGGGMRFAGGGSPAGYGFNTPGIDQDPFFSSPFYRNTNNYEWAFDQQTGAPSVRVKSGDKTGTTVKYIQDASGNWVPDYGQQATNRWDTNSLKQGWGIAMPIAVGLGGYALASAAGLAGAGAAGGAGGAGAGAGTAAGTGSSLVAGGAGTGAQTATTLQQALQYANYASKAASLAGKFTGNETLSRIGGITGLVTGGVGGLDSLYSGVDSGNWMDALKGAYGTYGAGSKLYNGLVAGDNPTQSRSGRMTQDEQRFYGHTQTGQGASAPRNWLDQILGVGAGVNSEIQNRETFTNLNNLFSRREQMRAPFEQKLLESYQNPDSFLKGDVYQAQRMLEQNKLDRGAAKAGRLANDVDRDVLMQAHALKALEGYRGGLRESLSQQQLPYEIFRDAQTRNANRGGPTAAGIGYSGVGGSINDIIKGATGVGGSLSDVYKWLTSGGSPETASDPYGPPVLPGDGHGGFSYGDFDMPTYTGDNYYGINFDDPSVWDDTSWMNGIDSWFDA